jgi:outer membrane protein insertion porin family
VSEVRSREGGSAPLRALWALALLLLAPCAVAQNPPTVPTPPPKPAVPSAPNENTSPSESGSEKQMPGTPPVAEQMLSSYEGQKVASVELAGRPDVDPAQFTAMMEQKPGEPFSEAKVKQTAAALQKAGKFAQVRIEVEPAATGVRVIYVLEPADWIGIFTFPGAQRFAYSELIQTSNYPVQAPYNAAEVEMDRKSLQAFFEQAGFFHAQVGTKVILDAKHALSNIQFNVSLGEEAKFGQGVVEGAPNDDALAKDLTGLMARLRGAGIRAGKSYHHSTIRHATSYLQSKLHSQGYLGAQVTVKGAEYDATTNRATVHFIVDPGAKTDVKIAGAHLWSWTKKSLLPMYQGIGVDAEAVQEGQQALISFFQSKGYFDVKVASKLQKSSSGDMVLYTIDKEKKHSVDEVHITGNKTLPDSKLMPSVAVKKKHLFSHGSFSNNLVRTSVNNLTAVYAAEGFSSAKVTSTTRNTEDGIQVTFHVAEGPRNIVNAVRIEGADTLPEAKFAPNGLKVRAGQPYSAAHVEEDRTGILANYLKAGYLRVSFRETASQVSKAEPHRIDVVYHIIEGPRVITGDVITLGRKTTNPRLIKGDIASVKTGTPLREQDMLTAGSKLYDLTGVFDWAEMDPKRQITTQTKEDVLVKLHEAKKNVFQYGFGFEVIRRGGSIPSGTVALPNLPPVGLPSNFATAETTYYGPRGTAQYTRNNLRGKGESLTATAFAGRLDQRGAIYYIDPNFHWTDWEGTLSASIERNEENPIFSEQIAKGSVQMQTTMGKDGKNTLFTKYSYSKTDLTRVLLAQLVPPQDQHIKLSAVSANFTRDTRDNPMDEHRGVLDTIEYDLNSSKLGSNVDFSKLTAQAAYYKQAFHNVVWAESVRIGQAVPFNNSFVPLSEEFFTGGGNSLRGIPLDSAGPQRAIYICPNGTSTCGTTIPFPTGGNDMLIVNSEARVPLSWLRKGLGYVLFYDGGNVLPSFGWSNLSSLYSNNVGVGLRYATPVGPIRFDLGKDLNPIPNTNPAQSYGLQYFIGIGQAF